MVTPDIQNYIARTFSPTDCETALALIQTATIHDGSPAGTHLLRCAVVASKGSLERLRLHIQRLKGDWRDVIVDGEYSIMNGKLVRVRNLNDPIDDS
jgi:limonene-1,2-epoxide hydrolase